MGIPMPRNATYDYARLLAAFGIVLFHAGGPAASIGYAALPFFLMLVIWFAMPAAQTQGFAAYTRTRAQRLLMPWLIWSALYGALKLAEVLVTPATFRAEFSLYMCLTGPALHLWFLPAAFLACLGIQPLVRHMPVSGHAPLALAMTLAALALLGFGQNQTLPIPFAQWVYVAPAACLGLALALLRRTPLLAGVLTLSLILSAWLLGWHQGVWQLGLAALTLLICGKIHLPASRASQHAAGLSLGIYLAHPMVFSVLERLTTLSPSTLIYAATATLGAMAIAALVDRVLRQPQFALMR